MINGVYQYIVIEAQYARYLAHTKQFHGVDV